MKLILYHVIVVSNHSFSKMLTKATSCGFQHPLLPQRSSVREKRAVRPVQRVPTAVAQFLTQNTLPASSESRITTKQCTLQQSTCPSIPSAARNNVLDCSDTRPLYTSTLITATLVSPIAVTPDRYMLAPVPR